MRTTVPVAATAASLLVLAAVAAYAGQAQGGGGAGDRTQQMDRDRDYDRDRTHLETMDRDRDRDRDYLSADQDRDRIRDRDRIHQVDPAELADEEIYGHELMTSEELKQYRNQLKKQETWEKRERFQVQHEEKLQKRAIEQGKDIVPPGQGPIYGGELMTVQERNEYREQLRRFDSDEERMRFEARHREEMQQRADALSIELAEAK